MKKPKHVRVGGRHFLITFDEDGTPRLIRERVIEKSGLHVHKVRWHISHKGPIPSSKHSIYARVIAAGREQS